jgi:hypothetical protein
VLLKATRWLLDIIINSINACRYGVQVVGYECRLPGRLFDTQYFRSWPISDVPNYIGSSTWSVRIFLRTSTESLPAENREMPSDCFYEHIRLTLRLSVIVSE